MEAKCMSTAQQRLSLDIITTLPQGIIETILCLLPIEEAARTSILSRQWRYKWTTIPKLVFLESTFERSTKEIDLKQLSDLEIARREKDMRCKLFAVHQVLLQRQGPIHEFEFMMSEHHTFSEIDQVILHLWRNHTVKKLTLDFFYSNSTGLPSSVFSLHHLTDLDLQYCDIYHKPKFNKFGSLTSLYLNRVTISRETLLHLLSNSPSLKSLYLVTGKGHFLGNERPNITELLKCLPVIEHLTTWDYVVQLFVLDSVLQELPVSLIHLKYFCFEDIGFANVYGLTFLAVLIKCSPNLEKLKLEIDTFDGFDVESVKLEEYSSIFQEYSKFWLEHLNELEIENFRNFKPELECVKLILARSPNLKKVILKTYIYDKNEELEMLKVLVRAPIASPVEIIVENLCKDLDNDD